MLLVRTQIILEAEKHVGLGEENGEAELTLLQILPELTTGFCEVHVLRSEATLIVSVLRSSKDWKGLRRWFGVITRPQNHLLTSTITQHNNTKVTKAAQFPNLSVPGHTAPPSIRIVQTFQRPTRNAQNSAIAYAPLQTFLQGDVQKIPEVNRNYFII